MNNNDSINESIIGAVGCHPVCIQQSVDESVMDMLKNSERITWDTLDLLTKEINRQNDKLDSIAAQIGIKTGLMSFPLVESIRISNLSDHDNDKTTLTGNPSTTNKQKEAMTQQTTLNTANDPETLKINMQKSQKKTSSSGGWPDIECGSHRPADNSDVSVDIHKFSLTESASNDFRQIKDKVDKLYDELISKLPITLPQVSKKDIRGFDILST